MYGSTAKAINHYKDKQKFIETPNFGGKLFCRPFKRRVENFYNFVV